MTGAECISFKRENNGVSNKHAFNMYPECFNIAYPASCCAASQREEENEEVLLKDRRIRSYRTATGTGQND
jgi:hypothetical protein